MKIRRLKNSTSVPFLQLLEARWNSTVLELASKTEEEILKVRALVKII